MCSSSLLFHSQVHTIILWQRHNILKMSKCVPSSIQTNSKIIACRKQTIAGTNNVATNGRTVGGPSQTDIHYSALISASAKESASPHSILQSHDFTTEHRTRMDASSKQHQSSWHRRGPRQGPSHPWP